MRFSCETISLLVEGGLSGQELVGVLRAIEADQNIGRSSAAAPSEARMAANDDRVWVYVMAVDHPGDVLVKVGISQHPEYRLKTLEREWGRNLHLAHTEGPYARADAMAIERMAHDKLSSLREHGEWFSCGTDRAVSAVTSCAASARQ